MNDSHRSCAEDYEISSPQLDELVAIMRQTGAVGARLTGAGFGGFAIGLVRKETAPAVRAALDQSFYRPRELSVESQTYFFRPAGGASVEKLGEPSASQRV
jgi:N-acetylgalactosamine kinase